MPFVPSVLLSNLKIAPQSDDIVDFIIEVLPVPSILTPGDNDDTCVST